MQWDLDYIVYLLLHGYVAHCNAHLNRMQQLSHRYFLQMITCMYMSKKMIAKF